MKNYSFLLFGFIFLINSCRMPADPVGVNVIKHIGPINTIGYCVDLDVSDSILIAAANYNGFIGYEIIWEEEGSIDTLLETWHLSSFDDATGGEQGQKVLIGPDSKIAYLFDVYNKLLIYDIETEQYISKEELDCYAGYWLDIDYRVVENNLQLISLFNHEGSDTGGVYIENSTSIAWSYIDSAIFQYSDLSMNCEYSVNFDKLPSKISSSNDLLAITNGELGIITTDYSDFDYCKLPDSTTISGLNDSLLITDFTNNIICDGHDDHKSCCEEFYCDLNDKDVFHDFGIDNSDDNNEDGCGGGLVNNTYQSVMELLELEDENYSFDEICDDEDDTLCICGQEYWDSINCSTCSGEDPNGDNFSDNDSGTQSNGYWDGMIGEECLSPNIPWGFGGDYEPSGGLDLFDMKYIDTPSKANTVFVSETTVFVGLANQAGCYMINTENGITEITRFAEGYSINSINVNDDIIALAVGSDGVLLFGWPGGNAVSLIGAIHSRYSYSIKVKNNHIFVATRDGIEIFQID